MGFEIRYVCDSCGRVGKLWKGVPISLKTAQATAGAEGWQISEKDKKPVWLCPECIKRRELIAAKNNCLGEVPLPALNEMTAQQRKELLKNLGGKHWTARDRAFERMYFNSDELLPYAGIRTAPDKSVTINGKPLDAVAYADLISTFQNAKVHCPIDRENASLRWGLYKAKVSAENVDILKAAVNSLADAINRAAESGEPSSE